MDFKLRGPGEFFGTRQHGLPELKISDLIKDFPILKQARADAFEIVSRDPHLTRETHQKSGKRCWKHLRIDWNLLVLVSEKEQCRGNS